MTIFGGHRRHLPFYAGIAVAVPVAVTCFLFVPDLALELAAVSFFLTYLVLTTLRVPGLDAQYLKQHVNDDDEPMPIIFAVTLAAVVISLVSLFMALNTDGAASPVLLMLAFASVTLGWLTIHTMAALHYAHLYWRTRDGEAEGAPAGGMRFPGTKEPGIFDFLYFSFVIGMTAQTSDVEITATSSRKVAMLHGVVSFFFNTVLVAAAVNAAVSVAA